MDVCKYRYGGIFYDAHRSADYCRRHAESLGKEPSS